MGVIKILDKVSKELRRLSQYPNNLRDYSRFYKDNKKHISLTAPIVRRVSSKYFKEIKDLDRKQIFTICEKLLKFNDSSCQEIAFNWAFRVRKHYRKEDFKIFETWLEKYVNSWAGCDDLCTHTLGYFLYEFPECITKIHTWTKSKNKWTRRASAVIFIYSTRRNKYLNDILKIAKSLLLDDEDLVQKGYGWMLKEASRHNQKEVFNFVMKYKKTMPRTALRYAIEKMPAKLKKEVMKKEK